MGRGKTKPPHLHQPDAMPGYTLPRYPFRTPPELAKGRNAGAKAPKAYPVAIVGAGLAGLTSALELASRGIDCVLLDDDDTVGASGLSSRGICYAKRTLEILDRFGAAERVRKKGVTWNEGDVYRGRERLYRFNLQPEKDQKFPAFVNLQQFYIEQYLVEALATQPRADLRWKSAVTDVTPGREFVTLKVKTPAGRYAIRARYVIGADGAHSIVRQKLKAKDAEFALFETAWCIADVKIHSKEAPVRKAFLDARENDGGAIWYHQMADGVWRTDWQISHYDDPEAEATPARARQRLRKLLGPKVDFELVWVGAWRFRRRYLEKMTHGRVFFMGDAAGQHSPFGARGGNRAVQDANNLAWKLALVLQGKAPEALLATYEHERHFATRENVEFGSRSAIFISPESPGQQLFRDGILDLAQADPSARALVNVGRLSVATCYHDSPLNQDDGLLEAPLARPGGAAPDGRYGQGFFVDQIKGRFAVAYFGKRGGRIPGIDVLQVPRTKANAALFERYGVPTEGATYVFRPDGHILARCRGANVRFARSAIRRVLGFKSSMKPAATPPPASIHDRDRLYDAFAKYHDETRDDARALARLALALAQRLPPEVAAEAASTALRASRDRLPRAGAGRASAASRRRGSRPS